MTSLPLAVLVNGQAGDTVGVHDRGFQYGDGVFETLAVRDGQPLLWQPHLARLEQGLARLGIQPVSADVLHAEAQRLCGGVERAVLKIIVTRGIGARGYRADPAGTPTRVLALTAYPDHPMQYVRDGIALRVCDTRLACNPALAGIKHLNRLEQILARAEWGTEFAEGLMCDSRGCVIEGTMSNFFIVTGNTVRTPDLNRCGTEGIMRATVLAAARTLGIRCETADLTRADLDSADEMFVTNSLIGLWPVKRLEQQEYRIGPITRTLQQAIGETHAGATGHD